MKIINSNLWWDKNISIKGLNIILLRLILLGHWINQIVPMRLPLRMKTLMAKEVLSIRLKQQILSFAGNDIILSYKVNCSKKMLVLCNRIAQLMKALLNTVKLLIQKQLVIYWNIFHISVELAWYIQMRFWSFSAMVASQNISKIILKISSSRQIHSHAIHQFALIVHYNIWIRLNRTSSL